MKSQLIVFGVFLLIITTVAALNYFVEIIPPKEPIKVKLNYNVGGCEEQKEREYIRFGGGEEKVDVKIYNGFINLTHNLSYVCCAKIKIYLYPLEIHPGYTLIKIKEKNEGEMCRCICDYKIDIQVGPLEKGKYLVQIFGVEFENMSTELLWEKEIEINQKEDFCGWSTYGKCLTDLDCTTGGCSGQVCQSKNEEPVVTACEWKNCYNPNTYGMMCKCVNEQCQWYKYQKE